MSVAGLGHVADGAVAQAISRAVTEHGLFGRVRAFVATLDGEMVASVEVLD